MVEKVFLSEFAETRPEAGLLEQGSFKGMNKQGYSIQELCIVLAISGILGAVAYPNIVLSLETYRLETSAFMVESKLADAKINAIKRSRQTWLLFDNSAKSVQIQYSDGGTVNVGPEGLLETGISFVSPTPSQIIYDPVGWPTSAPLTVRLEIDRSGSQKKHYSLSDGQSHD